MKTTPAIELLKAMGANVVDMRKPAEQPVEISAETRAMYAAGGRSIIEAMNAQKLKDQNGRAAE